MANPTLGWDRVPVFGWWSTSPGVPADGTIALSVGERIRRVDGRMIYPGGAKRRVKIGDRDAQDADIRDAVRTAMRLVAQSEQGGDFDSSAWDLRWDKNLDAAIFTSFWAADDPDITPQGYQVKITESLTSASGRVYYIEPLIADLDKAVPGQNLGMIEVPPGSPTAPAPIYAKGQRGGVAALDSVTGKVLDADGNEVSGGELDPGVLDAQVATNLADGGTATGAALSSTFANAKGYTDQEVATRARTRVTTHPVRFADVKRAKSGRIGTGGKPVVAVRVDHGTDDFLATLWPLMRERNIPGGHGVLTDCIENPSDPYEPTGTTWQELYDAHKEGFEIWSHSASHRDPADTGNTIEHELEGSRQVLEDRGFTVMGFQMPGISNTQYPHYSSLWDPATSWESRVGQLLLANYGLIEVNGIIGGARRVLPTDGNYDLGHYTLDGMDWPTTKTLLESTIAQGYSTEWMIHPRFVVEGRSTHTVEMFTSFLDRIVQMRDAGEIDIVTPSALAFADPDTARRFSPLTDASFEGTTEIGTATTPWRRGGAALPVEIKTDGGHSGTNYLRLPPSAGYTYVQQGISLQNLGMAGATFRVEAWARCTGSDTEASILVTDSSDPTALLIQRWTQLPADDTWRRVWCIFTLPSTTINVSVRLSRRSGTGSIDFDDVTLTAI